MKTAERAAAVLGDFRRHYKAGSAKGIIMNKYCKHSFICSLFLRRLIVAAAFWIAILSFSGSAFAYATWEGGDWGGMDFTPGNGDVLSGTFTNIGRFIINTGDTVYAGSSLLSLSSNDAVISGTLYGGSALSPSLNLNSSNSITMNSTGIIDQWVSIYLASGGTTNIQGTITVLNSGNVSVNSVSVYNGSLSLQSGNLTLNSGGTSRELVVSPGNTLLDSGGSINLLSVPIPAALPLFGSGLALLWILRRRRGKSN